MLVLFTLGELTSRHGSTPVRLLVRSYDGSPFVSRRLYEVQSAAREASLRDAADTVSCFPFWPAVNPERVIMSDYERLMGSFRCDLHRWLGPAERGYRTAMRAPYRTSTPSTGRSSGHSPGRPILRLVSPSLPPATAQGEEAYAAAENIMRSAMRAKRGERAERTTQGARRAPASG